METFVDRIGRYLISPFTFSEIAMLVLARRVGEEVVIGDNIRLVVISIRGTHVRLGFEAPSEVEINRQEVAARLEPTFELDPAMIPSAGEIEMESNAMS